MAEIYESKPYTPQTLRIIAAIKAVPAGMVSSYRDITGVAGLPQGSRQVARILHALSISQTSSGTVSSRLMAVLHCIQDRDRNSKSTSSVKKGWS